MAISLAELLEVLPEARVQGDEDRPIGKIECDSRQVQEGDLFVAIRGGEEQDRHQFIPDVVGRGAGAVVAEEEVDTGKATRVLVGDCRHALAALAAKYYDYPDRKLQLVGITGTNGKTTTALLIQHMLEKAQLSCGYVGTLGNIVDNGLAEGANTTPEACELMRLLDAMVTRGKRAAVLEVSSHGLALERVAGMQFKVGIFTNLTRDHLDFHRTEARYFAAKARLFEALQAETGAVAVINGDDPAATALAQCSNAPVLSYGMEEGAQIRLLRMEQTAAGMELEVETPQGPIALLSQLTGRFNSYNILAAIGCGLALDIKPAAIADGIGAVERVPGRFERVAAGQDFEIIVDYAPTPDALERLLQAARELTRGRLLCIFGCGGDRDRGKRPQMGRIAAQQADLVYVTSDNPRSETPAAIIEEIVAGMDRSAAAQVVVDRRAAIEQALAAAQSGDVVVIAGKGHETYQEIAGRIIDFDDRQVARQIIAARSAAVGAEGRG